VQFRYSILSGCGVKINPYDSLLVVKKRLNGGVYASDEASKPYEIGLVIADVTRYTFNPAQNS
jgi:hypothetical protein